YSLASHTSPPAIYTLSLHDALPIFKIGCGQIGVDAGGFFQLFNRPFTLTHPDQCIGIGAMCIRIHRVRIYRLLAVFQPLLIAARSEEHTSELQSRENLVCRLLLEKK